MRTLPDPYRSFRFAVEANGAVIGGFSSLSGLERDTTIEEYREGGVNDRVHRLVAVTKYPNLVLKRGLTDWQELARWHQDIVDGTVERQDLTIVVRDLDGADRLRWAVAGAYPVKWSLSDLDGSQNSVATESLEFAHNGIRLA